jgi:hypothetical protein
MSDRRCVQPGCDDTAPGDAPVALCVQHLALAAEWAGRRWGVLDTLPSPCIMCGSRLGRDYPSGWLCATCEWRQGEVPDHDLARPRIDVVYYLRHGDRVKIGTTTNPRQRFAAIWHDELLALERGDRHVERARHEQFAQERLERSEWFRSSPRLLAHIAAIARDVDPWDGYARWLSEAAALRGR